jgi:hypothetical protein
MNSVVQNLLDNQEQRPLHEFEFIELRKRHETARAKFRAQCADQMSQLLEKQRHERAELKLLFSTKEQQLNEAFSEERQERLVSLKIQQKIEKSAQKRKKSRRASEESGISNISNSSNSDDEQISEQPQKKKKIDNTDSQPSMSDLASEIESMNSKQQTTYITISKNLPTSAVIIEQQDQVKAIQNFRKYQLSKQKTLKIQK